MKIPRKTERAGSKADEPLTSDLKARIARAQRERAAAEGPDAPGAARDMSGMGRGLRLGSEFAAAIIVGAGMGYLLDTWLHTTPWLFLVMVMVGFAAGVVNVTRSAAQMNTAAVPPPDATGAPDDKKNV